MLASIWFGRILCDGKLDSILVVDLSVSNFLSALIVINGFVLSIFWMCVVERMILYSILIFDVSFSGLDFLGSNASVI